MEAEAQTQPEIETKPAPRFSIPKLTFPKFSWPKFVSLKRFWAKVKAYPYKSIPRRILRKVLALILSVLFLAVSLLFLGYSGAQILTNTLGADATVSDLSSLPNTSLPKTPMGKYRLVYEGAGVYRGAVDKDGKVFDHIFYVYPAWPTHMNPDYGQWVKAFPPQRPYVAALVLTGQGWIVAIFGLLVGLVMFEFFLLAWTIH